MRKKLINNSGLEYIEIDKNGLLEIKLSYEIPSSKRESSTKITYRVTNNVAGVHGNDQADIRTVVSATEPGREIIRLKPDFLSDLLNSKLVDYVTAVQPESVIYRKVDIQCFRGLTWTPHTGTIARAQGGNLRDEMVLVNSNLQETNIYRFKCESGLSGRYRDFNFNQREGVSLRCYVKGMTATADKPARFIILGTVFKSSKETFSNEPLLNLSEHLMQGMDVPAGTVVYNFIPVFQVAGAYRPVATVQIEGIKDLAGSKSRRIEKQIQNNPLAREVVREQPGLAIQPQANLGFFSQPEPPSVTSYSRTIIPNEGPQQPPQRTQPPVGPGPNPGPAGGGGGDNPPPPGP